ncbi:MAG: YifB family Mg chelatase-like AAA ATPase [Candidatus Hydrogenedentes bacterium]|nr:YifB family Mg chelatase-like AAA ATPase [Candidatus Hydrogenedentota bacterium]
MAKKRGYLQTLEINRLLKRDHTLYGGVLIGLEGRTIELQSRALEAFREPQSWVSAVSVTGMANRAVEESIDRISGAFAKYEIPKPEVRVVVNLAPADLPKDGTLLDLPLAIVMLQAAGYLPDLHETHEGNYVLLGEVGLHGEIRRVPGVLSMAYISKPGQTLIVPAGNEKECALIMTAPGHEGCKISAVSSLSDVIEFFKGKAKLKNALSDGVKFEEFVPECIDFGRIKGQERAKEAALIAAAGGHNLLLIGPPGEGKSLIASAIPGIQPRLAREEMIELTRIYSCCGLLERDGQVITRRPMRQVHHTTSKQALVGGGSKVASPGEITLSHLGILFLDELPEFSRSTLEALRQPMEQGVVNISRVGVSVEYPSRFTLVAAMNPCPCGYFGSDRCRCKESEVKKYQGKISGPILDRIDLHVEVGTLSADERFQEAATPLTPDYRKRVAHARGRQDKRFSGSKVPFNAAIPGGHVKELCAFSEEGFVAYRSCIEGNALSTRSMDRLAKVSRTVADLYNEERVQPPHVAKAAEYVVGGMLRTNF